MLRLVSIDTLKSNKVLFIFLIAFIPIHLIGIDSHGFWYDETITGAVSYYSVGDIIRDRLSSGHFPTYFILLKFWGDLFGKSEVSLRIPSLLSMTGAFAALWLICRRYFTLIPEAAALALVLFFFHPTVFRLSQEARMYGPILCLTLFSSYFFLIYLETAEKKPLIYCIAFLMAAISIHAQAFILLVVQFSFLLLLHRHLFVRYIAFLSVPLTLFLIVWKTGSAEYSIEHRHMNIQLSAIKTMAARAGLIAAGESDAFIFRRPPWTSFTVAANAFFLLFLASAIFWFIHRMTSAAVQAEMNDEEKKKHRLAFSYLAYMLVIFYAVLIVLGVLNFREPHRVRYQITVFPFLILIVAVGAVNLGAFLQNVWEKYQRVVYGLKLFNSNRSSKAIEISYIVSRCFAGCIVLGFTSLFLYALNIQMNWRGPGFKEVIILLKENYSSGDVVITCCMPKMDYGFKYFNAEGISNRLGFNKIQANALSLNSKTNSTKLAAEKKIHSVIKNSELERMRVWLLLYRDHVYGKPVIRAFERLNPEHGMFFMQKFPFAQLRGYERAYDPLGKKNGEKK
jgi:hypothetical protein